MPWTTSTHPGSTRQSRRERAIVLACEPVCYLQLPGCTVQAVEVDHVIPLARGGADNLANKRGSCRHCHRIKTQREAAEGRAANGRRRTPEPHPNRPHRAPGPPLPLPAAPATGRYSACQSACADVRFSGRVLCRDGG
jgi:5-methylcytosine-specific restriction protein A